MCRFERLALYKNLHFLSLYPKPSSCFLGLCSTHTPLSIIMTDTPMESNSASQKRRRGNSADAEPGPSSSSPSKKPRTSPTSNPPQRRKKGWSLQLKEIPKEARGLKVRHIFFHVSLPESIQYIARCRASLPCPLGSFYSE